MKNLSQMMKQAQEMQAKMAEIQARLDEAEITGAAGAGLITVTLSGKGTVRRIHIDPTVVDADDVAVLEDLITAAFNDAKIKMDALVAEKMSEVTGGLQLPPGMKLPF
ncbi:MAG: YbaB/EbfC family nucleoid-associated protein [Alphaproteobacteria bacterium]|nr:YbaB/EbfC family nucleoid-associated protein [Alphaproteobacteria bacterium]MCZ6496552.1 YbaB/EbfC family nucleoid-associated protein [Alphaproteobacteria bacterium]MCZ6608877.1 YbaB/EbfC family nucleoid-associated protein [Alphaproteobacteria bacterium]MCZ6742008.1 YbaB/EbfC family nucleoid-associated protein [Alphaproteobacteria bacterium]MCZ6814143.1 YbaB/EbfC family nucleoid-associated protein [Alphaproteobacteria bacterium]